jgi:phage gp36-like protein
MTYAVLADMQLRYGADEIAQRLAGLDAGALDSILADADALIDGYLGGSYALPLSPVPPKLTQVACAVTRYYLLGDAVTEKARNDFTDAVSWLQEVQSGVVTLQASTSPLPQSAPANVVLANPGNSVFKHRGPW